jgi:tetratricopeptide (TPR) repeat protein
MRILDDALRFAQANKWAVPEAELLMRKGLLFELQGRYGPAFEYMQRGYRRLTDLGLAQSISSIALSEAMALAYYKFGSNAEAIRLLRAAIDIRPAWLFPGNLRKAANTLGMCYIREEKYDSAALYFDLAAMDAMAIQDTFWAALARGNKGYALYQQQDYAGALPLLEEDFAVSNRHGDLGSAVNAAMQLAAIHVRNGEIASALPYLAYGEQHLDRTNAGALSSYYRNLAEVSRLQGRLADGLRFIDSFILYKDKHAREKDIQVIHQAKVKVEVEQYAHQLDLLEQQRSRQVLIRNGLIVILALGTVIALLVLRQYKARRLRERQLAQVREQAAQDELNAARDQLRIFTQALREKSELVETFRTELQSLQAEDRAGDRHEHLHQLLSSTILTEEDWKDFRILFDKVYPGFFERLRQQFTDLTPAETRLFALTKLQLTPKEMAGMLGISYDAIKKTRQRLRKKIDLPEDGGLDELVDLI